MMRVNFFDDPNHTPKPREEVRLKQLGIHVYSDRRRVAIGFEITPFLEGPSIEVTLRNERDEKAAALNVIESNETNFSLTMHLRDTEPTDVYYAEVTLYYAKPDSDKMIVDNQTATFDVTQPGDQLIYQTG